MHPLTRLVAVSAFVLLQSACGPGPSPPNLFVVVLDTTRVDRLTPYGYNRDTTPHLAAFAKQAIRFENAWSTSAWTVPAHASLFTGLLPMTHQATQETEWLGDEFETLAEMLSGAGWQTASFANNAWVGEKTNMLQGFEKVGKMWRHHGAKGNAQTNRAVRQWLKGRDSERPFFVFVNLINPHWRYEAPPAFQKRFVDPSLSKTERSSANFGTVDWYLEPGSIPPRLLEVRSDLYDAEIAWSDAVLGQLLEALEETEVADETLVVVTSDHGEQLGEHGHQGHSFALYEEVLRTLLLIRLPGGKTAPGTVRRDPVQLTDVFSTLAAAANVTPRSDLIYGRDLLRGKIPADRARVAEYYRPDQYLAYFPDEARRSGVVAPFERRIRAIQVGDDKLVWGSDGRHELFDLRADPEEHHERSAQAPETVAALTERLDLILESHQNTQPPQRAPQRAPDPVTEERLRDLGYIQ
jgi:arylsulfatase A-like enzyme